MSKSNACELIIPLNGADVDVHFAFWEGYEATLDDPGCDDEVEISAVWYPVNTDVQVNILPVMHIEDLEDLYDYIHNYRGNDED